MERMLMEREAGSDPISLFEAWFEDACKAKVDLPEAMTLATATPDGKPSARVVLMKQVDERGFVFFTNFESRKGRELAANPQAALVFWWGALERQVRVEGRVSRVPEGEADAYFRTRPRGSQFGAWASDQSRVVPGRQALVDRFEALASEFGDRELCRPPFWGGFRVAPETVEFWQGRDNRLHDRLRYRREEDGSWRVERLAP